jgi:ribonuclease PH
VPASRSYDRGAADLRPVQIDPGFVRTADGSALYAQGETRIICTASVTKSVPRWMEGSGRGWVTAEYAMLPASTGERKERDTKKGRQDGRGVEIQRLIGRSLRSIVDLEALGERSVYVDCDVLQADGGTRCASITGGYVALRLALEALIEAGDLERMPLTGSIAAVSCGIVDGEALLDLAYADDSRAEVDMNIVKTGDGRFIEIQGTAEAIPFGRDSLDRLLDLADIGIREVIEKQRAIVGHLVK